MEKKIKNMFDFQRFRKNERLDKIINEVEKAKPRELDDSELDKVNAAGEPTGNGGGAVYNNGEIRLDGSGSTFTGNGKSGNGGAIYNLDENEQEEETARYRF